MTTVTLKDGIIVADGLYFEQNSVVMRQAKKLYVHTDNTVFALLGDALACEAFIMAVKIDGTRDSGWLRHDYGINGKLDEQDGMVIEVYKEDGVIHAIEYNPPGQVSSVVTEPRAWGHGAQVALGAMYAGASASDALEIAAMYDPFTGGVFTKVEIQERKKDDHTN